MAFRTSRRETSKSNPYLTFQDDGRMSDQSQVICQNRCSCENGVFWASSGRFDEPHRIQAQSKCRHASNQGTVMTTMVILIRVQVKVSSQKATKSLRSSSSPKLADGHNRGYFIAICYFVPFAFCKCSHASYLDAISSVDIRRELMPLAIETPSLMSIARTVL